MSQSELMTQPNAEGEPRAVHSILSDTSPEAIAAPPRSRVSVQNVMIVALVALSAGSIYTMRKFGMGAGMEFDQAPIALASAELDPKAVAAFDRVLTELERSNRPVQIPREALGKALFVEPLEPETANNDNTRNDAQLKAEREEQQRREARRREIESALKGLAVQSVMGGRRPIATINGQIVREGDTLYDLFTVDSISQGKVVLVVDDSMFTLRVGEDE